jgi:hypothetical protein
MTPAHRAVVWIDQQQARIVHLRPDRVDETEVLAPHAHVHRHPKGSAEPHQHPDDQQHFFFDVVQALANVVGPSTAKLHFYRYLHEHRHALEPKVVGIETVDRPTDKQLVAYAIRYFEPPVAASR